MMCFAVRHAIEKELVESLFFNLSMAQLVNNKILQKHTKDVVKMHQSHLEAMDEIHESHLLLRNSSMHILDSATNLGIKMDLSSKNMQRIVSYIESIEDKHDSIMKQVSDIKNESEAVSVNVYSANQNLSKFLKNINKQLSFMSTEVYKIREMQTNARNSMEEMIKLANESRNSSLQQYLATKKVSNTLNSSFLKLRNEWMNMATEQIKLIKNTSQQSKLLIESQMQHIKKVSVYLHRIESKHENVSQNMHSLHERMKYNGEIANDRFLHLQKSMQEFQKSLKSANQGMGIIVKIFDMLFAKNSLLVLGIVGVIAFLPKWIIFGIFFFIYSIKENSFSIIIPSVFIMIVFVVWKMKRKISKIPDLTFVVKRNDKSQ